MHANNDVSRGCLASPVAFTALLILIILVALVVCLRWTSRIDELSNMSAHPVQATDRQQDTVEMLRRVDERIRDLRVRQQDAERRQRSHQLVVSLSSSEGQLEHFEEIRFREEEAVIDGEVETIASSLDEMHLLRSRLVRLLDSIRGGTKPPSVVDKQFLIEIERVLALEFEYGRPSLVPLLDLIGSDRSSATPDFARGRSDTGIGAGTVEALSAPTRAVLREMGVVYDAQLASLNLEALRLPFEDERTITEYIRWRSPAVHSDVQGFDGSEPQNGVDLGSMEASR